ncbi:MAG: DUF2089 family protein, partial [Candidatus Cloacimonetes bacterium]|nr:DUF2089 family protein [Candidatus Cloacimonadota bacterium]
MELHSCPYCKGELKIREYECPNCSIRIKGSFEPAWFSRLNSDQLDFIRLFVIVSGNIKEMEKRLKISYPTVKNRLAEIISRIGAKAPQSDDFVDIINDLE